MPACCALRPALACPCATAAARPDVISLTRYVFLQRHLQSPINLRACLLLLKPLLEAKAQERHAPYTGSTAVLDRRPYGAVTAH